MLKAIIKKLPWKDFFFGLFIPLNIMTLLKYYVNPLSGVIYSVIWCILYFAHQYYFKKRFSTYPVVVMLMILLHFGASFLRNHPTLYLLVDALENALFGLFFLASVFTAKPFILNFIEQDALSNIPEMVRNSPYYMKAWRIVSLVWGICIVGSALVIFRLNHLDSSCAELVSYMSGWPLIMFLLIFSVVFPGYYWKIMVKSNNSPNEEKNE